MPTTQPHKGARHLSKHTHVFVPLSEKPEGILLAMGPQDASFYTARPRLYWPQGLSKAFCKGPVNYRQSVGEGSPRCCVALGGLGTGGWPCQAWGELRGCIDTGGVELGLGETDDVSQVGALQLGALQVGLPQVGAL